MFAENGIKLIEPEIVFVTAYMSITNMKQFEAYGAFKIYEKPLLDSQLIKILTELPKI